MWLDESLVETRFGSSVSRPTYTGSSVCRRTRNRSRLRIGSKAKMGFVKVSWAFLRVRKKLWLMSIKLVMAAIGALIVFAQGSVFATFKYTFF
jgi:hypothetical protein